jgi:hypothetical protein
MTIEKDAERSVHPLTPERWTDIETVFGGTGDGGCWCMWWRLGDDEYRAQVGEENKAALKRIVDSGLPPGVIGYIDGMAAGWCSVGPREEFSRLESSPLFRRVDDQAVWSIVCYYVNRQFRGRGLMELLTRGAVNLARAEDAHIVEAYPVEISGGSVSHAYTGIASVMRGIGFRQIALPMPSRPIMRYFIE